MSKFWYARCKNRRYGSKLFHFNGWRACVQRMDSNVKWLVSVAIQSR